MNRSSWSLVRGPAERNRSRGTHRLVGTGVLAGRLANDFSEHALRHRPVTLHTAHLFSHAPPDPGGGESK